MVWNVKDLNQRVQDQDSRMWISQVEAEARLNRKNLAARIARNPEIRFLMIAGPSSSGKTTFARLLSEELNTFGIHAHHIGIDDYYFDRQDVPLDEEGNRDFECPEAIDSVLFNRDMLSLMNGKEIRIPRLNFITGHREDSGKTLRLRKKELLIIEGIHGLIDKLSESLPVQNKFKIFLCPQLSVNTGEDILNGTDVRLMRRIIRDDRTRGTSAARTIDMWKSVRRGEKKYIFPYIFGVDAQADTSLAYEIHALKPYLLPCLTAIKSDDEEAYRTSERLIRLLDSFEGRVPLEDIPEDSLLREFVGK
ncbi:MAG: nucleoside kinase [Blautia sp.]|nr:nucleoside kinase [Blautia sp.]